MVRAVEATGARALRRRADQRNQDDFPSAIAHESKPHYAPPPEAQKAYQIRNRRRSADPTSFVSIVCGVRRGIRRRSLRSVLGPWRYSRFSFRLGSSLGKWACLPAAEQAGHADNQEIEAKSNETGIQPQERIMLA